MHCSQFMRISTPRARVKLPLRVFGGCSLPPSQPPSFLCTRLLPSGPPALQAASQPSPALPSLCQGRLFQSQTVMTNDSLHNPASDAVQGQSQTATGPSCRAHIAHSPTSHPPDRATAPQQALEHTTPPHHSSSQRASLSLKEKAFLPPKEGCTQTRTLCIPICSGSDHQLDARRHPGDQPLYQEHHPCFGKEPARL